MLKTLKFFACVLFLLGLSSISAATPEESSWVPDWFGIPVRKIKIDDDTIDKVVPAFREGCGKMSNAVDNSIFNKEHFSAACKTLAYSLVGACIAWYGLKMFYDSYKNISEKMDAEENRRRSWPRILSKGDYLYTLASIGIIGCGFGLIANSNRL